MDANIEAQVQQIICKQLEVPLAKATRAAKFVDDLKADSLAVVELVLALEEAFDLEIPDTETEKIKTVGDAIDYITKHSKKT